MGFEPTTFCMASRCSSQLNYTRKCIRGIADYQDRILFQCSNRTNWKLPVGIEPTTLTKRGVSVTYFAVSYYLRYTQNSIVSANSLRVHITVDGRLTLAVNNFFLLHIFVVLSVGHYLYSLTCMLATAYHSFHKPT